MSEVPLYTLSRNRFEMWFEKFVQFLATYFGRMRKTRFGRSLGYRGTSVKKNASALGPP